MEYCTRSELDLVTARLGMLSGRVLGARYPGLKPWPIIYSRFAAKSDILLDFLESVS